MHDIVNMERQGVPGVFAATVEFASAVQAQATALGFDPAAVLTSHPIQDRTNDEMIAIADAVFADLVSSLTGPQPQSAPPAAA